MLRSLVTTIIFTSLCLSAVCIAQENKGVNVFRIAELNCENLFDTIHDDGFRDEEFLPDSERRWTSTRYRRKLMMISKELASISPVNAPDIIALIEVENDSVVRDLTRRTPLKALQYDYIITHSRDPRGIDIALLYQEGGFRPLQTNIVKWDHRLGMPQLRTRDLLHVKGRTRSGDTVNIIVYHAPSRLGGRKAQRTRNLIAQSLRQYADSIMSTENKAKIILLGDFNDTPTSKSLQRYLGAVVYNHSHPMPQSETDPLELYNLAHNPPAINGVKATYRFRGDWEMLDQCIVSGNLLLNGEQLCAKPGCLKIVGHQFLLTPDKSHGNSMPWRTYQGPVYKGGFSDHLPILLELEYRIKQSDH